MVHFSRLLVTIIVLFSFSGCTNPFSPTFPKMKIINEKEFYWEDIRYNNRNVHMMTEWELDEVQTELVNRRVDNNICAKIVNKYSGE